jgi:hypothetical protein
MALTGANLISRIQDTLQDTTAVRWTSDELLRYINDAQREIVNFKPEATAKHVNNSLATGTEQTVPGLTLIKVVRNMSSNQDGATGGRAVRLVDEGILNSIEPDWHNPTVTGDAAHGSIIKHYVFDPDDPKKFYVYPGVKSGLNAYIEIVYSDVPTDLSATSSAIGMDDIYGNAIIDFVLYRCYMKDSEFAGNAQRAGSHYQLFMASISGGAQSKILFDPNSDKPGMQAAPPAMPPGV